MKKITLIAILILLFISCSKVDSFILTQKLGPQYQKIKIIWTDNIKELSFNNQVVIDQGVYYLLPKKYRISWKYKFRKNSKKFYKWKVIDMDLTNVKELNFKNGEIIVN